ncbi:hypothetical protein HpNP84_08560 [Helicobacter pylori]
MMIFLARKSLRLKSLSQIMPLPVRTTKSWIISVWMKRVMSFLKYFENGVKMEIPKDFFGDFQKKLVLRSRV